MRGLNLVHPELADLAFLLEQECRKIGIRIRFLDTWRTKEEQNNIPSQNTNAKYPSSMHNWGVAFDFAIVLPDGKNLSWQYAIDTNYDKMADFQTVGQIGKKLGLFWGGDFTTIKGDFGHFQLNKFGLIKDLINKYSEPEKFKLTWTSPLVKEEEYKMTKQDADKLIGMLSAFYKLVIADEDKNEMHRLANELRKVSGQKTT